MTKKETHYTQKYRKNIALDMRKKGFSYSEIENRLDVARSTLSLWLKNIRLTPEQEQRLWSKRSDVARANAQKKKLRTEELIASVRESSAKAIQKISPRELWLLGVTLYWRERFLRDNEGDIRKGVRFTTSDDHLAQLFLKWLFEIGKLERDEIIFDIFVEKGRLEGVVEHWSHVTGFPQKYFTRIYFLKRKARAIKRIRTSLKPYFGLLRIRVRASSALARQIAGWIVGIQDAIK